MATFIMLTRLAQGAPDQPAALEKFQQHLGEQIRRNCPEVEWQSSFAVLGPYDYLDIFTAPGIDAAMRVAATVRVSGHAHTEVWAATELHRFKALVRTIQPMARSSMEPVGGR